MSVTYKIKKTRARVSVVQSREREEEIKAQQRRKKEEGETRLMIKNIIKKKR